MNPAQYSLFDLFSGFETLNQATKQDIISAVEDFSTPIAPLNWTFFPPNFIPKSDSARLAANLRAVEAVRTGDFSDKDALMRFVGWGGLANVFNKINLKDWQECQERQVQPYGGLASWAKEYGSAALKLAADLTPDEYKAAEASTLTAYYTPPALVKAMWEGVQRLGFQGGAMLEPACGIGYYLGMMPETLVRRSQVTAIEKDKMSGQICQMLFPDADVQICGFEQATVEPESFDLVITNVPFGQLRVADAKYRELSKFDIHNYFIGKSALMLREGGIMAVVTSMGTMDNKDSEFRSWLATEGRMELAGAFRLPGGYFKADAGTEVATDVLFLVKQSGIARRFNNPYGRTSLVRSVIDTRYEMNEPERIKQIFGNEYYVQNPGQVLGTMVLNSEVGGGMYRGDHVICHNDDPASVDISAAISQLPELDTQREVKVSKDKTKAEQFTDIVKIGNHTYRQNFIIEKYEAIKTAYFNLRSAEGGADSEAQRVELTQQYDTFVTYFGVLNRNKGLKFLHTYDPYFALMQALEIQKGGRWVKSDIFHHSLVSEGPVKSVTTIEDAITLSVWQYGFLNTTRMAGWLSISMDELTAKLTKEQQAFRVPGQPNRLIGRAEYLSGNVVEKTKAARIAAEEDARFLSNVEALEAARPLPIPFMLLTFTLSSSWIPADVFTGFIKTVLKIEKGSVSYNSRSRQFELKDCDYSGSIDNKTLGTKELSAHELLEKAINGRSINVTKSVPGLDGKPKQVADPEATAEAVGQQESLNELFTEYVTDNWQSVVETAYNETFNVWVDRPYLLPDKTHYPGASTHITLRKHQKRGVERIKIQDTCLAHGVGSGKTYTIISGAMELKRLKLANKVMVVVQNSTLENFVQAWKELYPQAAVMYPTASDYGKDGRRVFLQRVAHCDMDAVVIPQSMMRMIPDELASLVEFISEEANRMEALLESEESRRGSATKRTVKRLNALKERIEARRNNQAFRKVDDMLSFENLGIDALFIDEAHNYKRLGLATNRTRIKGIDTQGSEQALSAMCKIRSVQSRGGRVVLATGTPISNTMAEAWTLLRYIAGDRLKTSNIDTFDHFAGSFGQVVPSFELTPTGQFKAVERFAKFINVRTLIDIFRSHVDIVLNDEVDEFKLSDGSNLIPTLKGGKYTSIQLDMTDEVSCQLDRIKDTLKWFEKLSGGDKRQNQHIPLVMFGQARKVTIDPRLIDPRLPEEMDGKLVSVANEIYRLYTESNDYKGTQLVFSDVFQSPPVLATSGESELFSADGEEMAEGTTTGASIVFNAFDELKRLLVNLGIPAGAIATTPQQAEKREAVFAKVRTGEIRVLMGSTERMGVGVNVQDRVCGIHHMDAPNRPTDFEQRNGRGLRQGNQLAAMGIPMEILTYGVRRTMDATAYGRLALKQKFINQLLKGQLQENSCSDISGEDEFAAMSFDEMMATLSGSQTALLYVSQRLELNRLEQSEKNYIRRMKEANWQVHLANSRLRDYASRLPVLESQETILKTHFDETETVRTIEINEEVFTEEFGKALKPVFEKINYNYRRYGQASAVVKVNGLLFTLRGCDEHVDGRRVTAVAYQWGNMEGQVIVPGRLAQSIEANIGKFTGATARMLNSINRENKIVEQFSEVLNQKFGGEEQLKNLRLRVKELERQLQNESAETPVAVQTLELETELAD